MHSERTLSRMQRAMETMRAVSLEVQGVVSGVSGGVSGALNRVRWVKEGGKGEEDASKTVRFSCVLCCIVNPLLPFVYVLSWR